jgi:cation diffusion facilitator family transporter
MDDRRKMAGEQKQRLTMMSISVAVSAILMALKFYTYYLTGSAAILSDALESIINVVASGFALWSVIIAAKPPDTSHPYGHGKIEYFSAGFEGALITIASGGIIWQALPAIWNPGVLPGLDYGLLILAFTAVANLLLGMVLIRTGQRTRSAAVLADGKHILTDVYTTGGVLIGLLLVRQTGWYFLDGAIACLVALNILVIGTKLVLEAIHRLMDASDPDLLDQIAKVITERRKPTWIDIHRLRAWRSGDRIIADLHLILPRDFSLEDAHRETMEIEQMLRSHVPGMGEALVHAEPCIGPECPICSNEPCEIRVEPVSEECVWHRGSLSSPSRWHSRKHANRNKQSRQD